MTLVGLRILPPFAIGRLGSAEKPLVNYTLAEDPERPLDFHTLQAAETFEVDEDTGEIRRSSLPTSITFKDEQERIRPVAPFLEVFAETREHGLVPLTTAMLRELGVSPSDLSWRVEMGNRKVARRTGDAKDGVQSDTGWFSGHDPVELHGHCPNFVSRDASIRFGRVRFIRPNGAFPQIRMRFTPAQGLIYGPKLTAEQWARDQAEGARYVDNLYQIPDERAVYDPGKGGWYRFEVPAGIDNADPDYRGPFVSETLPPSLFAIQPPGPCWLYRNVAISRGYFDDACDGVVTVRLRLGPRRKLEARARLTSAPPMVIPDTLFLRSLADDLDQVIHGPAVPASEPPEVTRARAMDIVRRAFDTVRFLNVAVMNGNPVQGRDPLLFDTMPAEEAFDTGRLMRPVVPERTADTLMIQALHQQVFAALRSGTAPWFGRMLRMPTEVADFTDHGRRKMPAMMCGADGSYLALTWRQIQTIFAASSLPPGPAVPLRESRPDGDSLWPESGAPTPALTPRNLSAQLHYAAAGNPASSRPVSSIGNCTPGLEVDFRAVWRRVFQGLVLREWDNLVVEVEPGATDAEGRPLAGLRGCRLLRVDGRLMMAQMLGPSPADTQGQSVVLSSDANPFGVAPLEWSNGLAHTLKDKQGGVAVCDFTRKPVWLEQAWWTGEAGSHQTFHLEVRHFFEPGTAVIAPELAQPGELTQGLCSPWQNDYRECSCYYWASARPDYVNVEPTPSGASRGDNWMQKVRSGQYVADDYVDGRLLMYDDLFHGWEKWLRFQVAGRDAPATPVPLARPASAMASAIASGKPVAPKASRKRAPAKAPRKRPGRRPS